MDQNNQNYEEMEIDLSRYVKVIAKHKMAFIMVFLLILAMGFANIRFSPKIYKITMIIQPPVIGESLVNRNYPEALENIKFLLLNGTFNTEIIKRLHLGPDKAKLNFEVSIPPNTNFLMVSINQTAGNQELGVKILKTLFDTLSEKYSTLIQNENDRIDSEIKIILNNIASTEENIGSLEDRLKEIAIREDKLLDEIKLVSANTADITNKRDILLKDNPKGNEMASLLYSNVVQFNLGYMNQLNNQLADAKGREIDRQLEIKDYRITINNAHIEIDKLKLKKQFSSNLKISKEPEISHFPVSPSKMKILIMSIVMGLFFGLLAVFLQEFWVNNLAKK